MPAESAPKRRRTQRSPSPEYGLDNDNYEPYIPVAQRRQAKLAKLTSWGTNKSKVVVPEQEQDERDDEEREEERRKEKARKERTLLMEAQEVHERKAVEGMPVGQAIVRTCRASSLLQIRRRRT